MLNYTQIQLRQGIKDEWLSSNPVLSIGEPGYEIDTRKIKIGNGTDNWNDLNYLTDEKEIKRYIDSVTSQQVSSPELIKMMSHHYTKIELDEYIDNINKVYDEDEYITTELTYDIPSHEGWYQFGMLTPPDNMLRRETSFEMKCTNGDLTSIIIGKINILKNAIGFGNITAKYNYGGENKGKEQQLISGIQLNREGIGSEDDFPNYSYNKKFLNTDGIPFADPETIDIMGCFSFYFTNFGNESATINIKIHGPADWIFFNHLYSNDPRPVSVTKENPWYDVWDWDDLSLLIPKDDPYYKKALEDDYYDPTIFRWYDGLGVRQDYFKKGEEPSERYIPLDKYHVYGKQIRDGKVVYEGYTWDEVIVYVTSNYPEFWNDYIRRFSQYIKNHTI